jgi:hypothetical protein
MNFIVIGYNFRNNVECGPDGLVDSKFIISEEGRMGVV